MAYINGREILFSPHVQVDIESQVIKGLADGTITALNIPYGTTIIRNQAFASYYDLVVVTMPETLTDIGFAAFRSCIKLKNIEIPSSVKTVAEDAFRYCNKLESVVFKGKPTSINANAFGGCSNLLTIDCPWQEGEVEGAPWGATNATIVYTG